MPTPRTLHFALIALLSSACAQEVERQPEEQTELSEGQDALYFAKSAIEGVWRTPARAAFRDGAYGGYQIKMLRGGSLEARIYKCNSARSQCPLIDAATVRAQFGLAAMKIDPPSGLEEPAAAAMIDYIEGLRVHGGSWKLQTYFSAGTSSWVGGDDFGIHRRTLLKSNAPGRETKRTKYYATAGDYNGSALLSLAPLLLVKVANETTPVFDPEPQVPVDP